MNKIEEILIKFEPIKNKIESSSLNELMKSPSISILSLLKSNRMSNSLKNQKKEKTSLNRSNITNLENNPKSKSKDKNKFCTKIFTEQNNSNIINLPKGVSPLNIPQKNSTINSTNQYKQKNIGQNNNRNNINNGNYSNNNNSITPDNINLLELANGERDIQDVQKLYKDNHEKEEKMNMEKNINKNDEISKNNKDENNLSDNEIEEDLGLSDDEIENKEKNENQNKIEKFDKNLIMNKKESAINFNENIDMFANLMGDEDDLFNDNNDNSENLNNNENLNENNNNSNDDQRNNVSKSKNISSKNNEKEKNRNKKNNITGKNENTEKEKDNINNDNNLLVLSNSNKISIPLEEDFNDITDNNIDKEKNNKKENKSVNSPEKGEKIEKKKKEHKNLISKKNIKSKSCISSVVNNNHSNRIKKKIIMDDEEESLNNNKDTSNNLNLSLSKTKNENVYDENISDRKESIIDSNGNKFRLFIDYSPKENSPAKEGISDKTKKNINENDYDLLCIDNINKILNKMENKLKKENIEKKISEKCSQIINSIKNNQKDLDKRKKNTYLGILKILGNIFSFLCDIKKFKAYINEICQILEEIENYYIQIKKFAPEINNEPYHHNKKIVFKYIYSSLKLKNYDSNSLKDLISKNENIDIEKFVKIYKRYKRTSEHLIKEVKDFREKLNNPINKTKNNIDYRNKYESCPNHIQTSPNFMSYMKLFNHYSVVLSFVHDYKVFNEELERMKKNGKLGDTRRDKSMQINKNGVYNNLKNRERSRYKEIEKEREKEKEKEKK